MAEFRIPGAPGCSESDGWGKSTQAYAAVAKEVSSFFSTKALQHHAHLWAPHEPAEAGAASSLPSAAAAAAADAKEQQATAATDPSTAAPAAPPLGAAASIQDNTSDFPQAAPEAPQAPKAIQFLDVAAGPGYLSELLSQKLKAAGLKDYSILCTDISPGMLDLARAAILTDPRVSFAVMDGQDMSCLPDASVHGLGCMFGVQFMPDFHKCIREMRRVLRPGARATVGTWLENGLLDIADAFGECLGALGPGEASPGRRFSDVGQDPDRMAGYFREARFDDVIVVQEEYELEMRELGPVYHSIVGTPVLRKSVCTGRAGAKEPSMEEFQVFLLESPLAAPFRRTTKSCFYAVKMTCNLVVAVA